MGDLNKPDFSSNLYFEANAVWFGDNEGAADKEFLDTYYQTGLTETAAGTADQVARGHILKTASQDAYDEIAATFLGCGNLNPVALPTFPTGITWGDTYATKGPTYYTVAGTMQEISSSYGTQNSTSKASSLAEGVVADLVAGPSLETIDSIEGAIFTVYAQSTLRYAANMTLDAHLPGNGMGGSTKPVELTEPTIETGVTACGVNQLTLTEADCAALVDFEANSTCAETPAAYALAGSPDGSLDFDFPLCCNIASNAPGDIARTVPTEWDGDSYIPPAGTGWVDVSWLRAGIDRYAEEADVDDPATNSSALANTYLANTGVTYAGQSTSATGAADAKQWGGLTVQDDGTITQPASGCMNSRANAMGVGNSFSAWAQKTSESFLVGNTTEIAPEMFLMDSLDTRLVPYYIGQFGDVDAAQDLACWKLQASGIVAEFVDEAATAEVAEAAYSPSIVSTYPCGPSMSSFASNHCSDGGDKETGPDLPGVIGNADRVNPRVASVVGGQAIFNIIAAVFADTDASTDVEADTNFNCARNLDAMFQVNEGAIIKNVDGTTYEPATEAAEIAGDMPGAVSFPTWYVAIGTDAIGLGSTGFVVPNGFCYTNACMTEFMKTVLDGDFELGKLIKDPNMANPVPSSSKCGQALTACGSAAGYQSITGDTDKWDGKEWPVPMEDYVASTDGEGIIATEAVAAGTAILPSALTSADSYADITAFRGPVF